MLVFGRQTGPVGMEDHVVCDDGAQATSELAAGGEGGERGSGALEGGDPFSLAIERSARTAQAAGLGGHQGAHGRDEHGRLLMRGAAGAGA